MVFKASLPDGQDVALKKLEGELLNLTPIIAEIKATIRVSRYCASVCRIKGVAAISGSLILVLKLYKCSLKSTIELDYPGGYPLAKGIRICIQIALALNELHLDAKMVSLAAVKGNFTIHFTILTPFFFFSVELRFPLQLHLDLKPDNVLMNDESEIVLSDFGLSAMRNSQNFVSSAAARGVGTLFYMSPEQMDGEGELGHIGTPCDVW